MVVTGWEVTRAAPSTSGRAKNQILTSLTVRTDELTAPGLHALREEHTCTPGPARALAAEILPLERTLSDPVHKG